MDAEKIPEIVRTTEKSIFEYRLKEQTEHDGWIDYLYEQWLIPSTNNKPIDASKENHGFEPILTGFKRFQITDKRKDFHAVELEMGLRSNNIK